MTSIVVRKVNETIITPTGKKYLYIGSRFTFKETLLSIWPISLRKILGIKSKATKTITIGPTKKPDNPPKTFIPNSINKVPKINFPIEETIPKKE